MGRGAVCFDTWDHSSLRVTAAVTVTRGLHERPACGAALSMRRKRLATRMAVPMGTGATTKTLSFSSSLFPAHKGTALYPLQSKVNHSCSPNCFLLWNRDSTVQLVAMEEIPKGTELTINYLGDKSDAYSGARRRRWLRENYGFDCACVACRSVP